MRSGVGARQGQHTTSIWKKKAFNFTSLVALNFPPNSKIKFPPPHLLIKQMIRSSHSHLCKKSNYSVKLQDGLSDHNPRRIPAHDFTFNIYKLSDLLNCTEN